jgi:hypothetical protein
VLGGDAGSAYRVTSAFVLEPIDETVATAADELQQTMSGPWQAPYVAVP